jgi:hypothetical protein
MTAPAADEMIASSAIFAQLLEMTRNRKRRRRPARFHSLRFQTNKSERFNPAFDGGNRRRFRMAKTPRRY